MPSMKVKENLPWSAQSPVIHLVQPCPLEHEMVFREDGKARNAIYALTAQRHQKRHKGGFEENKEINLSFGFISLPIHPATEPKMKKKNSFYDLRVAIPKSDTPAFVGRQETVYNRSMSVDGSSWKRKTSMDFDDILRHLGVDKDKGETNTSCEKTVRRELVRADSTGTWTISVDSSFYDVPLDGQQHVERSHTSSPVDLPARQSFSDDTFNKTRLSLARERSKFLKERTSSVASSEDSFDVWGHLRLHDRVRVSQMVDSLLVEIYGDPMSPNRVTRRRSSTGLFRSPAMSSAPEDTTSCTEYTSGSDTYRRSYMQRKGESASKFD